MKGGLALTYFFLVLVACQPTVSTSEPANPCGSIQLTVLGIAQDAGAPQISCKRSCCADWKGRSKAKVSSIGITDPENGKAWIFDASPDFTAQWDILVQTQLAGAEAPVPSGIFLTHAHIGHYTGLMYLGKEALGAQKVPVHCMPRMRDFLAHSGPWSQLVNDSNIILSPMLHHQAISLQDGLVITPLLVPHRDEFSETVGYHIQGPSQEALFIPDIDKWERWSESITDWIERVDYAFVDATFYSGAELWGRDMSQIPHPSVQESMKLFDTLQAKHRSKIYFIHINHTNPLLDPGSKEYQNVIDKGYHVAQEGMTLCL